MAGADEEWAVEYIDERAYDVVTLLDYDALDVKMQARSRPPRGSGTVANREIAKTCGLGVYATSVR
jgi:hypothetical protein